MYGAWIWIRFFWDSAPMLAPSRTFTIKHNRAGKCRKIGHTRASFITIRYCGLCGRSESRIERRTRSFQGPHEAVPENDVKSSGHTCSWTVLHRAQHPPSNSMHKAPAPAWDGGGGKEPHSDRCLTQEIKPDPKPDPTEIDPTPLPGMCLLSRPVSDSGNTPKLNSLGTLLPMPSGHASHQRAASDAP